MEKKLSFDIGIVAPILLGVFSLLGICVVFGAWRYKDQRAPVQAAATETPFRYIYLGTEPGLSTLTPEPTETPVATETQRIVSTSTLRPLITLAPPTSTSTSNSIVIPTQTRVKAATPTITPTIASVLSKVDDTNSQILYIGNWAETSNVADAYQGTLHISSLAENAAQYTFVGQQVIVSYQVGPSLGIININLDGLDITVNQSSLETEIKHWTSLPLIRGQHNLLIEHISGGSVNIDAITIPDLSTPTPITTP